MGTKITTYMGQGVAYKGLKEPNKCPSMVSQNLTDRKFMQIACFAKRTPSINGTPLHSKRQVYIEIKALRSQKDSRIA